MNFKLKKPDILAEAQRAQKGWNVILEILLFFGFFILSQLVISLCISIPIGIYAGICGFQAAAANAAPDMTALMNQIMLPAMILQLYAELLGIFLILGLCKWIQKRKGRTLGFKKRNWLKEYGWGMLAGFSMMTVIVLIGWGSGSLKIRLNTAAFTGKNLILLLVIFVGFLFQGMFEEVLCRGYFLLSLARKKGNIWMGIIVSSVAFAALHLGNPGITALPLLNLTLFGIFAGIYFVKRGDLWGIGALHSLWNFTQGNIWGVLVSGNDFGVSLCTAEMNESMTLLNGGSFGLEGGLIVTAALVIGCLLLLRLPQKDLAQEIHEEVPAAPEA